MKNRLPCFLLTCMSLPLVTISQMGKVMDNLSMTSKIKMERKYAVYLPPDYENSECSYPVLYLLHGGGDDQTGWIQFGEVMNIAVGHTGAGLYPMFWNLFRRQFRLT